MLSSGKRREEVDPKQLIIAESGGVPVLHNPRRTALSTGRARHPAAPDFLYPSARGGSTSDECVLDVVDRRRGADRGGAVDGDLLPACRGDCGRLWRRRRVAGLEHALPMADRGGA